MGLDRSDAEDVAQETLLAFAGRYRGGAYDRSKGRLSKWLFGIAYRQVLNARRRLARREAQFPHDAGSMSAFPGRCNVLRLWEEQWGDAILQKCLARIRWEVEPTTLRAFERVVRDQLTPIDTAKELGISVKSVYNAKHRILKRIRELRSLDLSPEE